MAPFLLKEGILLDLLIALATLLLGLSHVSKGSTTTVDNHSDRSCQGESENNLLV
jgi:hypothetical protein